MDQFSFRRWRRVCAIALLFCLPIVVFGATTLVNVTRFGVQPNTSKDVTPGVLKAIAFARNRLPATLIFPKGRYEFWPEKAAVRRYFISNHDDVKRRAVAFPLENLSGLTLDGQGSDFIFHELILPIAVVHSHDVTLTNFSLDYATPHLIQSKVVQTGSGWIDLRISNGNGFAVDQGHIEIVAEKWKQIAKYSIEFDPKRKGMAWNTADNWEFYKSSAKQLSPDVVRVSGWKQQPKLGDILVLWSGDRPNPAILASGSRDVSVVNVTVHSAQGMGFIAQKSEDIHLNGFNVSLRPGTPRYITTVADAAHFSNCKGSIAVENGLFENMLDDGINVHGSYLLIIGRPSPNRVLLKFGHPQSFGFTFAAPGEHIEFVDPQTALPYAEATVRTVKRVDDKHIELSFDQTLPARVRIGDDVNNRDWEPTVIYRHNHIRNNRARGALFSTPAGVIVEDNFFDHLAGPAILMSGATRDWFESAPSHNVTIRHNRFVDPLIAKYGDAPIMIVPPWDPKVTAAGFSVKNIRIEDNYFRIFDKSLLDAVSTDGLVFRNNVVEEDHDFPPNLNLDARIISLTHVKCVDINGNKLPWALTPGDVREKDADAVEIQGLPSQSLKGCAEGNSLGE